MDTYLKVNNIIIKKSIKDLDELELYFDDKEFLSDLLENGEHVGEWYNYHLVEFN